jgi:hypothetical protein
MRKLLLWVWLLIIASWTIALIVVKKIIAGSRLAGTLWAVIWVVALVMSILCDLVKTFGTLTFVVVQVASRLWWIKINTCSNSSTFVGLAIIDVHTSSVRAVMPVGHTPSFESGCPSKFTIHRITFFACKLRHLIKGGGCFG